MEYGSFMRRLDASLLDYLVVFVLHMFVATGIFENQEEINRRVLARFSDVCDKQFPSLQSTKDRFESYWKNISGT